MENIFNTSQQCTPTPHLHRYPYPQFSGDLHYENDILSCLDICSSRGQQKECQQMGFMGVGTQYHLMSQQMPHQGQPLVRNMCNGNVMQHSNSFQQYTEDVDHIRANSHKTLSHQPAMFYQDVLQAQLFEPDPIAPNIKCEEDMQTESSVVVNKSLRKDYDQSNAIKEKNRNAQKRFRERQKRKIQKFELDLKKFSEDLQDQKQKNEKLVKENYKLRKQLDIQKQFSDISTTGNHIEPNDLNQQFIEVCYNSQDVTEPIMQIKQMWEDFVSGLEKWEHDQSQTKCSTEIKEELEHTLKCCLDNARTNPLAGCLFLTGGTNVAEARDDICNDMMDTESAEEGQIGQGWGQVAQKMELDEEQIKLMVQLRDTLLKNQEELIKERESIAGRINTSIPGRITNCLQTNSPCNQEISRTSLKLSEYVTQLKENLKREHEIQIDFVAACLLNDNVINLKQLSKVPLKSFPDVLAIANNVEHSESETRTYSYT